MKEQINKVDEILNKIEGTTSGLNEEVVETIDELKDTIKTLLDGLKTVEKEESCKDCGLNEVFELLTNTISKQLSYNIDFQEKIKEREDQIKKQQSEIVNTKKELYTDVLTKIKNRNKYEVDLDKFIKDFKENGEIFSYSLLDIDFFKKFNDTYGHKIGDAVLKKFANDIQDILTNKFFFKDEKGEGRQGGIYRFGGEEFIIMGKYNKKEMSAILAYLNRYFNKKHYNLKKEGKTIQIKFSAGLVQFDTNSTKQSVYEEADKLLYEAKEGGRNRFVVKKEENEEDLID